MASSGFFDFPDADADVVAVSVDFSGWNRRGKVKNRRTDRILVKRVKEGLNGAEG